MVILARSVLRGGSDDDGTPLMTSLGPHRRPTMEAWSQHPLEALQRTLCTSSSPRLHGKSDKFVLSRMLLALTFDGMKPQTVQIQHHRLSLGRADGRSLLMTSQV
jgi:hypothetical protein